MLFYLSSGIVLGLTAGVAPGPLLTLVVTQTVNYGVKEGFKTALAPLITDPPIIFLSFFIGAKLACSPMPLGLLSMAGAGYIGYLAWQSLKVQSTDQAPANLSANSIQKGVLTNFLNPHPYLFWITVGIPFILKSWASGPWGALTWLAFFYVMLVGSKMAVAMVIGRSKNWLFQRRYVWLNRGLGLVLLFFAIMLAKDGISLMGFWPR